MNKLSLIFLFILVISCGKKEINQSNYLDFSENVLDTTLVNFNENNQLNNLDKLNKEVSEYFGDLDKEELKTLQRIEVQNIKKSNRKSMPSSRMFVSQDTSNIYLRRCGAFDSADSTISKGFENSRLLFTNLIQEEYIIPIHFYIINKTNSSWDISQNDLEKQVEIINQAYKPIGIKFVIESTKSYNNDEWYYAYKTDKGDKIFDEYYDKMVSNIKANNNKLNIFINGCNLLGQATFPFADTYRTSYDNVIINGNSLFGKKPPNSKEKMEGKTLTHELGHFFGLYHTFHSTSGPYCNKAPFNGCKEGDLVADTPPQKYCHFFGCGNCDGNDSCEICNSPKICDTCDDDLVDDVDNFMGYNPDSCMNHFTKGQYDRMQLYLLTDRDYLYSIIN